MKISWYGQSAFALGGTRRVAIDPFGAIDGLAERGLVFDYPPIEQLTADLLLITHEHPDHNAAEVVGGDPLVIRSTAGRIDSPIGEIIAIASEHDAVAGTERGPNTIFCFNLDGVRCCHLGDLGQHSLRPEQQQAIGSIDVLFVPVGDGPTIGGAAAAAVVRAIGARVVVPMHYGTEAVNFLEPPDDFLDALGAPVERLQTSDLELEPYLRRGDDSTVVLPAPPLR